MEKRLEDKVAIITGGARGIGKAVSLAFAREGARVVIFDVVADSVNTVAEGITEVYERITVYQGDIRDRQRVDEVVRGILEKFNKIDILVNNAGVTRDKPLYQMTDADWDDVVDISLKGTFNMTQAVTNWMIPQAKQEQEQGKQPMTRKIINTTSGAVRGNPGQANYSAAKAGIIGLTRSNARELGNYRILVNAISPVSLTEMTRSMKAELARRTILKRIGDPERDIAPAFVFLASDEANYITGQIIGVNGGMDTQY